jgi:sulfoxide reductase heme-binding subunit YedZ
MATARNSPTPWLKPALLTGAFMPLAAILIRAWRGDLSADPIAQALNQLGLIALIFLIAALGCTPLRSLFGWTWPLRIRRILGVLAFTYAAMHVISYTAIDQGFDWHAIGADIIKRKFIFAGFLTFVLLIPLAVTSTNASVRRLGYPRWKKLHRLAYIAPIIAVIHFVWRVKRDVREPVMYGLVLATLLLIRVFYAARVRWSSHPVENPMPVDVASRRAGGGF